jgi:hypothetical protein
MNKILLNLSLVILLTVTVNAAIPQHDLARKIATSSNNSSSSISSKGKNNQSICHKILFESGNISGE